MVGLVIGIQGVCCTHSGVVRVIVGTTIAAIIALLVVSGDKKVSTKDAFTLFENNTGWSNSMFPLSIHDTISHLHHPLQTLGHSASHSLPQCGLSPAVRLPTLPHIFTYTPPLLTPQTTLPPTSPKKPLAPHAPPPSPSSSASPPPQPSAGSATSPRPLRSCPCRTCLRRSWRYRWDSCF